MKILKPGQLRSYLLRGTCDHCRAEVECLKSEAREVGGSGGEVRWWAVDCPTAGCFAIIRLGETKLPESYGCNASGASANVLPHSENCNHRLRQEGKPNPRTCAVCKLGPCAFRIRPPGLAPAPPPPPPPRAVDARAFPRPDPYAACPLTIGGKPFAAEEFYNR